MAMVLKTIRALTCPRGFESHALRPPLNLVKLSLTWAYTPPLSVVTRSSAAARCSRLPPYVAGRGVYARWTWTHFPGRGPSHAISLADRWPGAHFHGFGACEDDEAGQQLGPQRPPLRQLACLIAWSISRRRIGHGAVVMPGVRVLGATRLLAGDEEVLTFDELPIIRMCA